MISFSFPIRGSVCEWNLLGRQKGEVEFVSASPFVDFSSHRRSSTGDALLLAWSHDAFVSKHSKNKERKCKALREK